MSEEVKGDWDKLLGRVGERCAEEIIETVLPWPHTEEFKLSFGRLSHHDQRVALWAVIEFIANNHGRSAVRDID